MKVIDWSIKQRFFEVLLRDNRFSDIKLNSEYSDATYRDYSNCIYAKCNLKIIHIAIIDNKVDVIAHDSITGYAFSFTRNIDIEKPDFPDIEIIIDEIFETAKYYEKAMFYND